MPCVARNVVALDQNVSEIDPDPKQHTPALRGRLRSSGPSQLAPPRRIRPRRSALSCCLCWLAGIRSEPVANWPGFLICRDHIAASLAKDFPSVPPPTVFTVPTLQ
jgi:hypothetical protein